MFSRVHGARLLKGQTFPGISLSNFHIQALTSVHCFLSFLLFLLPNSVSSRPHCLHGQQMRATSLHFFPSHPYLILLTERVATILTEPVATIPSLVTSGHLVFLAVHKPPFDQALCMLSFKLSMEEQVYCMVGSVGSQGNCETGVSTLHASLSEPLKLIRGRLLHNLIQK